MNEITRNQIAAKFSASIAEFTEAYAKFQVNPLNPEILVAYSESLKKLEDLIELFCESYLIEPIKGRALKLRPAQLKVVAFGLSFRNVAIAAPRGLGKSVACAITGILFAFIHPEREEYIGIIAPDIEKTRIIFDHIARLLTLSKEMCSFGVRVKGGANQHIRFGKAKFKTFPVANTNQGQSCRGQHFTMLLVDESGSIADDLYYDNVEPTTVVNKAPMIHIGNLRYTDHHFFNYLFDGTMGFKSLIFTWEDGLDAGYSYEPSYTLGEIQQIMKRWGKNSAKFLSEYENKPIPGMGQVFAIDDFIPSMRDYNLQDFGESSKTYFLSLDVARKQNSTVILTQEYSYNNAGLMCTVLRNVEEIIPTGEGLPNKVQIETVADIVRRFQPDKIGVDATSGGQMFLDDLKDTFEIPIYAFRFDVNKGAVYLDYKDLCLQGRCVIPRPSYLREIGSEFHDIMDKFLDQHLKLRYDLTKDESKIKIEKPTVEHDDFPDAAVVGHGLFTMKHRQEGVLSSYGGSKSPVVRSTFQSFKFPKRF